MTVPTTPAPATRDPRSPNHLSAAAMALVTTALGIALAVVLTIRWQQPAYVMPVGVVVVGVVCAVLTTIGGIIATRQGHLTPWLAPAGVLLVLFSFLFQVQLNKS